MGESPAEQFSEVSTSSSTVADWVRALAAANGNPGGGAASGLMLSIAAGLTAMVAGYTDDRTGPSHSGDEPATTSEAVRERAGERARMALRVTDEDAQASRAFGQAFHLAAGPERDAAIRTASVQAATASAELGRHAIDAIDDLAWLAGHGNPALIADVAVAIGALRAALTGARTNVSFDLGSIRSAHESLDEIHGEQSELWRLVPVFEDALARLDRLAADIDHRAAPTR
ncbi:MAG TPA: cyclodeaminase/cyclohydrolase family protein [Plantibacter sp.]|uniref:cyclodeaminase/cyclohydrolase family protein n=1 Tax=unclassified Plantibacter TaxID=2624265 RepID=UPI002C2B2733|nr:cyclodeaminase/cyclohydrolase family protein [Plantibacter sp.]